MGFSFWGQVYQGPRFVVNALERIASGYASETVRVRQDLSIAESQLRDYQARLGKPFPHQEQLLELTGLRDQFKSKLTATGRELQSGGMDPPPALVNGGEGTPLPLSHFVAGARGL